MAQITDIKAKNINPGDKPVNDGVVTGLRLVPGKVRGHGKWILRYVSPVTGKRRDMGLGTYPETSIASAREKATAARKCLGSGQDPIEQRVAAKAIVAAQAAVMTFEQAARKVHADWKAGWRNPKHADQWINTLRDYVFPLLGNRKVDDLTAADFAAALKPIWLDKVETATRVKQRCHKVISGVKLRAWCRAIQSMWWTTCCRSSQARVHVFSTSHQCRGATSLPLSLKFCTQVRAT